MANEKKPAEKEVRARTVVSADQAGIPKKSSTFRKLTRIFLTDNPEEALRNMVTNVAIPTFKKGIVDAFSMVVLGRPAFGSSPLSTLTDWFTHPTVPGTSGTPYWQFSNTPTPPPNAISVTNNSGFRDTLWFRDGVALANVLNEINDIFTRYKMLRLQDLYDAAGYTEYDWQAAQYWGWTDLSGIQTYPESGGYTLKMPPIKNIR